MGDNKIREIRVIRENPRFRRYPKYKESGVEWIGKIPAHWKIEKIKHIATLISEKSTPETGTIKISPENVESKTGKVLDFYSSYDSSGVKFQVGDVLFNKIRVYLNKVVFAEYDGYSLGEMIVVRPSLQGMGKYLFYLMLSSRFIEYCDSISYGAKMPRTAVDDILNAQIPITSNKEQTQIANFLDQKMEQIDELIRIKERRIELLQEQRTALINQVVTKGLDPNVEMKPSGVEWIGEIPGHWEVINTKYLFRLVTEPAPKDNDYELLSIYTHIGVKPRKELEAKGNRATTTDGYWLVKKGDFIVNKLLAWMGAIGLSNYEGVTSPAYDILRKIRPLNERFYEYLFRCGLYFTEFKRRSRGIMEVRLRLYFDQFGQIPLVFPPVHEQDKITNFLDHKTGQIDQLTAAEQRKIELLKEYRQSLISEAVTGKIDVRDEV